MHKFTVGNVEVVSVLDMVPPGRGPAEFFDGITEDDWAPYWDEYLENGKIQLYYGHFFVRSEGKTIMVDTGMGPGPHLARGFRTGDLLNQLRVKGVKPDDVDIVVHTHLHGDHVGWNLDLTADPPTPYFPNARYLAPRVDWEYFMRPEILENAPWVRDSVVPLQGMELLDLIDSGHEITGELTTLATPGHTPGHQIVMISSQGEKAMIVGDAIHSAVQIQEPGWCASVDTDKDQSRNSREDILSRAESEGHIIAAGHFHPKQHVGRVVVEQGRRVWQVL